MKFRAIVTKQGKKGKVKVQCPKLWGETESPWCFPCVPILMDSKDVRQPRKGEELWIEFEEDDIHSTPIYVGTWGGEDYWD